ncbi:hypothetical protein NC652_023851 [Populus alba x Populus x berolinensis]|nr:hypothetical protein NC652_023844 [Populus alba x Populus x berolinensis]KAJ6906222.1 hypothetical protein NC652_023851 [Populus alba x Populus x berolinensis]
MLSFMSILIFMKITTTKAVLFIVWGLYCFLLRGFSTGKRLKMLMMKRRRRRRRTKTKTTGMG